MRSTTGTSKRQVFSSTFSFCSLFAKISAPVASITTERLGCRIVSLVGCVWAALSILGAYFSENVDVLILSNGASLG